MSRESPALTLHVVKHFTSTEYCRNIVIGISAGFENDEQFNGSVKQAI